jgi:surfeit locus 1 family protein
MLVGVVAAAHLGVWQLDRAAEKQALLDQIEAGEKTTRTLTADASTLQRYQAVTAQGRYDAAHQVLLDNMPSLQGFPGYRVLTPFELSSGGWVLVDRGWLPIGATRDVLPSISVADTERTIVGRLDEVPRPGMRLGSAPEGSTWPRVMNYPEHSDLERVLDRPLGKRIVRLDPAQPDGYERTFVMRPDFGPNRHIAYAVQWFALAVAMMVIYVLVHLKRNA